MCRVPGLDRAVATGGGQTTTVWRECNAPDAVRVAHEHVPRIARFDIPQPYGRVAPRACCGQECPGRGEGHSIDAVGMGVRDGPQMLSVWGVPYRHGSRGCTPRTRDQRLSGATARLRVPSEPRYPPCGSVRRSLDRSRDEHAMDHAFRVRADHARPPASLHRATSGGTFDVGEAGRATGECPARGDVPKKELAVSPAGDQPLAVRSESHADSLFAPMSAEGHTPSMARREIPESNGPIVRNRGREPIVGRQVYPIHLVRMSKDEAGLSCHRVPYPGRPILASRGEATTIGRESYAIDIAMVMSQAS